MAKLLFCNRCTERIMTHESVIKVIFGTYTSAVQRDASIDLCKKCSDEFELFVYGKEIKPVKYDDPIFAPGFNRTLPTDPGR